MSLTVAPLRAFAVRPAVSTSLADDAKKTFANFQYKTYKDDRLWMMDVPDAAWNTLSATDQGFATTTYMSVPVEGHTVYVQAVDEVDSRGPGTQLVIVDSDGTLLAKGFAPTHKPFGFKLDPVRWE